MKTIKITLLFTVTAFFISIPNAAEAKHCSHVKILEEKLLCAVNPSEWNKAESSSHEVKKDKKEKKAGEKIDTLEKLFKKLSKKKK